MMEKSRMPRALWGCATAFSLLLNSNVGAADVPISREQFLQLQQENQDFKEQLHKQQQSIDSLTHKFSEMEAVNTRRDHELNDLREGNEKPTQAGGPFHLGKVNITGEGGLAFFHSEGQGNFHKAEFRVDEAKVFVEAPVWKDVYFFTELNLVARESVDLNLRVGELYLDFENISQLWGHDRQVNLRVGRFYIPFGEEYLHRFAIDNPLISHSLGDLWGVDEGVELYGSLGKFQYVLAVQNGGIATSEDFNPDKAIVGRVGYDPNNWLHLSVSGMRTGDMDVARDGISELWFGSGWIRSIGSPQTAIFRANLAEGDVQLNFTWAQFKAAGGYINYEDNDPLGHNHRDVYYYYVEGARDITRKLYGAARFSQILAPGGFPIVGNGNLSYFGQLSKDYWRLSLGLGYRFSPNLVAKAEYSFNEGRSQGGAKRINENLFAMEAAFRF